MADRVPEIQNAPQTLLRRILFNDASLNAQRTFDERVQIVAQMLAFLEFAKQRLIARRRHFDALGKARGYLARAQRIQRIRIDHDLFGG